MVNRCDRTEIVFYRTESGAEIVRDWLKSLQPADRAIIGQDLMRLQFRWPVGMPLCRSLGDGLWEVRSNLTQNRISRVLFCVIRGKILILQAFIKKTTTTPRSEIDTALKRKREFER